MNISKTNNTFKGYDVIPLRALYMQGLRTQGEINIFREIKRITDKEGLNLFLNQDCCNITEQFSKKADFEKHLSIWGQDTKAFVLNKQGKTILWNTKESLMSEKGLGELNDFKIDFKKYMPRGGNYFLGYNQKGDKWILINSQTITDNDNFNKFGDIPTQKHIKELFNVEDKNIFVLNIFNDDLDEVIRPIGYPNILVNDYDLSLVNLEKMKEKFPGSYETINGIKNFIKKEQQDELKFPTDEICEQLKQWGFNPIRIGGRYIDDINYMNAIAFNNNRGKISYITNSTRKSYPELEYLEKLFEEDLKTKVPDISDTYFVSGGKRQQKSEYAYDELYGTGLQNRNTIMDILANRFGGIHCMTAEIPDFDKLKVKETMNVLI